MIDNYIPRPPPFIMEETQVSQDVLEGRHLLAGHIEVVGNPLLKNNKKLFSTIARDFRMSVKNIAKELDEKVKAEPDRSMTLILVGIVDDTPKDMEHESKST